MAKNHKSPARSPPRYKSNQFVLFAAKKTIDLCVRECANRISSTPVTKRGIMITSMWLFAVTLSQCKHFDFHPPKVSRAAGSIYVLEIFAVAFFPFLRGTQQAAAVLSLSPPLHAACAEPQVENHVTISEPLSRHATLDAIHHSVMILSPRSPLSLAAHTNGENGHSRRDIFQTAQGKTRRPNLRSLSLSLARRTLGKSKRAALLW